MSQKTLNLCLERYNFVKFGETTKSSHTVLCINNAYSVNSDKYRLTPAAIAGKHGEGYVFTLNYDFDRPLFTIVQKSYALDGTSGNIVFEGIDPISKGGSKYLRKVTVSPVKLSDGSYLLEVTNDEYLRIGTTGAALGDEDLESLNEKIVAMGGIEKSVETVGGKQVLKLDASGSAGAKEIVYFDVDPSDPPSGIYEAIGEALANNKLPAIRSDGKLYLYTSTGIDKYDFVGVFDGDVGYELCTVWVGDAVNVDKLESSLGYVAVPENGTEESPAWAKVCEVEPGGYFGYTTYGLALLFNMDRSHEHDESVTSGMFVLDVGTNQRLNSNGCNASWMAYTPGTDEYSKILGIKLIAKYGVPSNPAYHPYPVHKVEVWVKYYGNDPILVNALQNARYNSGYGMAQNSYKFPEGHHADTQTTEPYYEDTEEYTYREYYYTAKSPSVSYTHVQSLADSEKVLARDNIGAASASDVTALQSQVSSLSDVSAYSPKGEATVAQLNAGPSGIQAGWAYQLTDSGTLTNGTLAVVAGDTVAWDGTKWFPLVKSDYYATKTYAQNVAHSIAPEFDPNRTSENPYPKNSSVAHEGKVYNFFKPHYGPWTGADVKEARSAPNNLVKFHPIVLDKINEVSDVTYESGVLKTDGEVQVISGFHTSDYIEVDASKTYQARLSSVSDDYFQICLYDANKNLIGGVNEGATPVEVAFNFASAVKYFRISINASFYVKERLASSPILFNTDIDFTLELLDATKFTANTYIGSSGQEVSFNGATASDYIPVTAGLSYAIRDSFGGSTAKTAFYDFTKKFISAVNSENSIVTAPANAKYMRVSLRTAYIATASVCKGSLPLPSIPIPYGQTQFDIVNTLFVPAPYVQMEMLDLNKDVTFENGVFDQSSSDQFKTSDYINLITTGTAKSEFFFVLRTILSSSYDLIRFYDKDKNVIAAVKGGDEASIGLKTTYPYKVIAPKNCVYIRYAQGARVIEESWGGIATLKFGAMPDYIRPIFFTETNNLLWIGTSIPEGAEYPMKSSKACGYNCINKSLGSSMLRFTGVHPTVVEDWSGKCLTATVDELETLYRDDVTAGIITEERLNIWKNYSYENSIIPYIDGTNDVQVSAIILDHGFNDKASIHTLMQNPSGIDWTSTDRANFVGAFNYLYRKILEVNPFVKLIISGYFQNIYDGYYSKDICDMQELIADKYDLQLMPAWKYSGINFEYVPGSSDYISDFNSTYSTNYTKMNPDGEGNIPLFQFFCPDKVHPHSDKTGNCNRRLNAVYTKMLKDSL